MIGGQRQGMLRVDRCGDRRSFSETAPLVKPRSFFVFLPFSFQSGLRISD